MLLVIPSIELSEGNSISRISSQHNDADHFSMISQDPMTLSMHWRKENAKCLHIIDMDSYSGENNFLNTNSILYLLHSVDIPIQYSSDFANTDECRLLLDNNVYRIIVGELAITDPKGIKRLIEDYTPSRIAFKAKVAKQVVVFTKSNSRINLYEYAEHIIAIGGNRLVFSDESWSNQSEPDFSQLEEFANKTKLRITIINGISNYSDLAAFSKLTSPNLDSCIIGKALYENRFPCQAIWRMAETE